MPIKFKLKSQPAYKYNPLHEPNAIRLLRLDDEPNTLQSDVHGTLIHTTIDSAPPYFALSYCWGKLKQNDELFCGRKLLRITPSLAEALRRLRSLASDHDEYPEWDFENRYFWIDQICINQADTEERQSQVQMMGHIYSHAIRTLIWLGPDREDAAHEGFSLANRILDVLDEESEIVEGPQQRFVPERFDQRIANVLQRLDLEYGGTKVDNRPWSSFVELLCQPWSRRLWVIQEVVLSAQEPVVLCGRSICGWSSFASSAIFMISRPTITTLPLPQWKQKSIFCISSIQSIRCAGNQRPNLAILICLANRFFTSNPRDRIFGLLGLAYEGTQTGGLPVALRPDYRSETYKIYARVARYFIMEHPRSLAPICYDLYAHAPPWVANYWPKSGRRYVPTWTPNWNHQAALSNWVAIVVADYVADGSSSDASNASSALNLEFNLTCNAAANIPVQTYTHENNGHVRLRGIVVDTVTTYLPVETDLGQQRRPNGRIELVREYLSQETSGELQRLNKAVDLIDRGVLTAYEILSVFRRPLTLRILEAATARRPEIEPLPMLQLLTRIFISTILFSYGNVSQSELDEIHLDYLRFLCTELTCIISDERRRTSQPQYLQKYDETLRSFSDDGPRGERECFVEKTFHGRRFFITSTGNLGVGPACMRKGDIVGVLFGSGVPFIMRRKIGSERASNTQRSKESDLFAMVGPCYVDGIMKGEAVEAAREGTLHERDFEIF